MSIRKQADNQSRELNSPHRTAPSAKSEGRKNKPAQIGAVDAALQRVVRHITSGNYQKALDLLKTGGGSPQVKNLQGVCLMRLGRADEAVQLYRALVLKPGCTWMRPEAPTAHKVNFATALLLAGRPSGCLEMLSDVRRGQHPIELQLRAAIKRWQQGLSWRQWIDWKWFGIEPSNCRVPLDFPPGELDLSAAPVDATPPAAGDSLETAG